MALEAHRYAPPRRPGRARKAAPCCGEPSHTTIRLTGRHPVRVAATGAQELRLALDVSDYDEIDIELRVFALVGAGASLQVTLETGMQRATDHGWTTLATFPLVSAAPGIKLRNLRGLLRYLRWNVTTLTGTAATFLVDGIARTWAPAHEHDMPRLGPAAWRVRPSLPALYPTAGSSGGGGFGPSGQAPPASPGGTTTPSNLGFAPVGDEPPLLTEDEVACLTVACPAFKTCCPQGNLTALCADLSSDPQHCGQCDNACGPSQVCLQGTCRALTESALLGFDAIEFYERAAQPQLIVGKTVSSPSSRAWAGAADLNALPQTPTEDVLARFVSTSGAGEVNLFAFDPAEAAHLLQAIDWGVAGSDPPFPIQSYGPLPAGFYDAYTSATCHNWDILWDTLTSTGFLPDGAAMRPGLAGLPEMTLELSPGTFWASGVAQGLASQPTGTGSVKAVRLLNHGECSARRSMLQDILQPVTGAVFEELVKTVADHSNADDLLVHFIHATAYLDNDQGIPRGGFIIDLSIEIGVPLIASTIELCATASYELYLPDSGADKGLLRVRPTIHSISGAPDQAIDLYIALRDKLPKEFARIADGQQLIDPLAEVGDPPLTMSCLDNTKACQAASDAIVDAIFTGAQALGLSDQHIKLSDQEIQTLQDLISEPDPSSDTGLKHWRCGGMAFDAIPSLGFPGGSLPGICKLIVRAKRLNLYPDEIELVWFDGKELDNPAYALFVAAFGAKISELLCNPPINEPTGNFRRPYATYAIGPLYLDF